ncbi:phosphatase [Fusibacter bizertensis]|uniref:Phosphatase n=1 Tax=Fusibacter bizertensis TaxID=1488331 RepID=A0ABT6NCW7_9FIRM|nr:phosphatase [Fusibacter bizertensis]MDH8678253.1 phosphatase [Fusibacter bizertensis]
MFNKIDMHTHTVASGHAYSTLMDNIRVAKTNGIEVLGISDHAPAMPGSTHEYYFSNLRVLPQYIEGIRILKGVELNILDVEGNIDLDERTLSFLDYAIASLHPPCYEGGSKSDNTNALINAMQHKIVKIIGHPDDGRYPLDYEKLVKAAQKHGVLLEVNNSSLSPNAFRENAYENYKEMLAYCMKQGVKIIINSDAHFHDYIGATNYAMSLLEEINFPKELIVNMQALTQFIEYNSEFEKNRR